MFRGVFILFAFLCVTSKQTFSKTIIVDQKPNHSIHNAINQASDGDLIIIKPGIYNISNINITKSLHIKGEGFPIIDGQSNGDIFIVKAPHTTIEGLIIKNVGSKPQVIELPEAPVPVNSPNLL